MNFRARLQPWIHGLTYGTRPSAEPTRSDVAEALESGIVRIPVSPPTFIDSDESLAEGLELLSLLAQVDYDEWKAVIHEIWPQAAAVWCHHFQGRRFRLGCQVTTKRRGVFTKSCQRFLVSDVAWVTSKKYEALRQELEDAIDRRNRQDTVTTNQPAEDHIIPVRLVFANDTGDLETHWDALWFEVVQLAAIQAVRDQYKGKRLWKPLFRLDAVLPYSFDGNWTKKDLMYAREIAACGIAVQHLRLYDMDVTEAEAQLYIPIIQEFLGTGWSTDDSASRSQVVNAVGVQQLATTQTIDSIFSAVLMSSSVHELHVQIRAGSGLKCPKTEEERGSGLRRPCSEVSETLNAADSISFLFPRGEGSGGDRPKRKMLRASSFRLNAPQGDSQFPASTFKSTSGPIWVLDVGIDNAGSRQVVLPDWGLAWVEPADVAETKTSQVRPTPATQRLEIVFESPDSEDSTALVAFFRAIGAQVRKISFKECNGWSLEAEEMRDLIRACPNLEEFAVDYMYIPTMLTFAAAYEDGSCRVKNLELLGNGISDENSASQFFDCLANENHPMSKHLTGLQFAHGSRSLLPQAQRSALRMLEKNRTLQEFSLDMSVWRRSESEIDPDGVSEELFMQQDGIVLGGRGDPLRFKSKVAFLSVVWGKPTKSSSETKRQRKEVTAVSIPSLDTSTITTIFEFAANCKTRLVRVKL